MSKVNTKFSVEQEKNLFSDVEGFFSIEKGVQVSFTAPDISTLGGIAMLSKAEMTCGIISSLSGCINDWRDQGLIHHTIEEMVSQRVMQIACGYEDADDCDTLRGDSMLKMGCGRAADGHDLCSQPTMSRLENHVEHDDLYAIGEAFIDNFIKSYGGNVPAKIIIDLDDSNANAYGAQQLCLFNQYYGEYCFMPLFIFEGYSGRLILPILRPGRVSKRINSYGIIRRLVARLRKVWPNTVITIRGDAMFCCPELMEWADSQWGMHYCTGLSGNSVLLSEGAVVRLKGRAESEFKATGKPARLFSQFLYKAETWDRQRWVIVKVEHNERGGNVRFIVTDRMPRDAAESQHIYDKVYCKRGDCELYIRELKEGLHIDRMSCHSFSANQTRVFLHAAAYVLMWHMRHVQLKDTEAESWSMKTMQLRLLKSAVRVTTLKTKIKVEFGRDHPDRKFIVRALTRA